MKRPRLDQLLPVAAKACGASAAALKSKERSYHVYEARLVYFLVARGYAYRQYEVAWSLEKSRSAGAYYEAEATKKLTADRNFKDKYLSTQKSISKWFTKTNTKS